MSASRKKAQRNIRKLQKELREWRDCSATQQQLSDAQERLNRYVEGKSVSASTTFEILGNQFLTRGSLSVLSGDHSGWSGVDLGYRCYRAAILLGGSRTLSLAGAVVAHAGAANRGGDLEELTDILEEIYKFHAGSWDFHAGYQIVPFALAFQNRDHKREDLGEYSEILSGWRDSERMERLLEDLADRHLTQAVDRGSNEPEFANGYELLPVELLWVQRCRFSLGLELVEVDHPLLELNTSQPPDPWPDSSGSQDWVLLALERAESRRESEKIL
mgnify:CR=1 FL=1